MSLHRITAINVKPVEIRYETSIIMNAAKKISVVDMAHVTDCIDEGLKAALAIQYNPIQIYYELLQFMLNLTSPHIK
jgi:hypothetical protein